MPLSQKALGQYLLQSLNMTLGSLIQEESYINSFSIFEDGFVFIPRLPASYLIDDEAPLPSTPTSLSNLLY